MAIITAELNVITHYMLGNMLSTFISITSFHSYNNPLRFLLPLPHSIDKKIVYIHAPNPIMSNSQDQILPQIFLIPESELLATLLYCL